MDELSSVFEALANEHRREMILALALRPHAISELAAQRGLSLPAVHKHIAVLEDAALIRRRKVGRTNIVALQRVSLRRLQAWVDQFHPDWGTDAEDLDNYADHFLRQATRPKESK